MSSSELTIISDNDLETNLVSFFVADSNLLSCEFDRFTFQPLYWIIFYIKQN